MENRLTFVRYSGRKDKNGVPYGIYTCSCSNKECQKLTYSVETNHTRSCGCIHKEITSLTSKKNKTTHNKSKTRKYRIWASMKDRCLNPDGENYERHMGRGISVCDRWLTFENFDEDMSDPPSDKHTIDRKDNNLGYFKENCKWSTRQEQSKNRGNNVQISFRGESMVLTDWAKKIGIDQSSLAKRLKRWTLEEALTKPVNKRKITNGNKNNCF